MAEDFHCEWELSHAGCGFSYPVQVPGKTGATKTAGILAMHFNEVEGCLRPIGAGHGGQLYGSPVQQQRKSACGVQHHAERCARAIFLRYR